MDLGDWLRSLGLGQYEAAFRENEIDDAVLPSLTAEDLKDIGVSIVGHRRKLLDAIAGLRADASLKAPPPEAVPPIDRSATDTAERRQLTVMFCDLVGSTALSSRLDPEDLREIIGVYHRSCTEPSITKAGGFVAKYMGDGVLAYFGYPQAHEDDAERAVRAGLAIIGALGQLSVSEPLQVRIGIGTGPVVVGDLLGAGEAQERCIVGETPNLAARLQALAEPNTVVVDPQTRQLLADLFDYRDLGPVVVKGLASPVPAYQVLRPSVVESRFEALHGARLTPLVGREEELELLLRRWRQAKAGEGRVVLISGEPGIGKSRLAAAFSERIAGERYTRLRYFCSPHHQDSVLYPTIIQFERAAGFTRDDTVAEKDAKLRALVEPASQGEDEITLIAELLSLPNAAAELNLSPQRKREKLLEALLHQLEGLTRRRPVLTVWEDVHWIDPTSRELLELIVDRVRRLPVFLVITFRPEFQSSWGDQPHVTMLTLNRLGERDGAALVQKLAGNAALAGEIIEEIVERTDGVPLFVEELTKAVLETEGEQDRVEAVLTAGSAPTRAIPATLQASLIARLDRLGTAAKEVAQIGAVLGREFGYELIQRVAQRPDLDKSLAQLAAAGLLFCRGVAPHSSHLFKHALVQDAAYGTLLRARRQELHARVATVLEQHFADLAARRPELLAHHLTGAGEVERAVAQWLKAGQFAAARLAHREAIRHFDRGLGLLGSLPEGSARDGHETELLLGRGLSLFTTEGFNSTAAAQGYERASELAERRHDARQLFMAVYGQWQSNAASGRVLAGSPLSQKLLNLTESEEDIGFRLQAHHSGWTTRWFTGELAIGRRHCEAGRRLYDPERHRSHRLLFGGHDPGVCAFNTAGQIEWLLGYPDTALASGREGLALAERIAHPFSLLQVLIYMSMLHLNRREPDAALQSIVAAETLAAEQRLALSIEPRFFRGGAFLAQGAVDEAVVCLREGLGGAVRSARPYGLALLAEALALRGKHGAALAAVEEGLQTQETTGQRTWDAELHRLKGIALLDQNKRDESQSAFEESLRVARRQQVRAYELRAATSLARLWGEEGKRTEARDLLAPVYGWFTEGFDTPDLKEAKALLDGLAS
jgi:class 3 adenylate cyclase